MTNEYAKAGVDPTKIEPFKAAMLAVSQRTIHFPLEHDVRVFPYGTYQYVGRVDNPLWGKPVLEGLGNKNWIAEWMYQYDGTGRTHYRGIGIDVAMMAVNDLIAQGAMPVTYNDEVAAGTSEWFADERRARAFAQGIYDACAMAKMALVGGESPALRYLVRPELPVTDAPVLSGSVTGIIGEDYALIDNAIIQAGDRIIGVASSGVHSNGISLIIKQALGLKDSFLTKLPTGRTLGEEALIPTLCYVDFVKALIASEVDVHGLQPGTGGGVGKVAFDKRNFTYRIHSWLPVPPLFLYMRELGVPIKDCLETFNWGVGYYAFVPSHDVDETLGIAEHVGLLAKEIGVVEEGRRCTIFGPEGDLVLSPPGD